MIITVLWLFLTVRGTWVGLQCVIVVFPDHTHLFFYHRNAMYKLKLFNIMFNLLLKTGQVSIYAAALNVYFFVL